MQIHVLVKGGTVLPRPSLAGFKGARKGQVKRQGETKWEREDGSYPTISS